METKFTQFTIGNITFMAVNHAHHFVSVAERHTGIWHNPVALSSPELVAVTQHASDLRDVLEFALEVSNYQMSRMEQGGFPIDPRLIQQIDALKQRAFPLLGKTPGGGGIL